jgi:hypothetical protein
MPLVCLVHLIRRHAEHSQSPKLKYYKKSYAVFGTFNQRIATLRSDFPNRNFARDDGMRIFSNPQILPVCRQAGNPQIANSLTASQAIMPMPVFRASSSMSKVGVWTGELIPLDLLPVPSL